jgi:hypothetical protein
LAILGCNRYDRDVSFKSVETLPTHEIGKRETKKKSSYKPATRNSKSSSGGNTNRNQKRCQRSLSDPILFDPRLRNSTRFALPGSVNQSLSEVIEANSTQDAVGAVLGLFFLLKLLIVGHPQAKPYFKEICQNQVAYKNKIDECELFLFLSLQKFGQSDVEDVVTTDFDPSLRDSLDTLIFGMNQVESNSVIGRGLSAFICSSELNDNFMQGKFIPNLQ